MFQKYRKLISVQIACMLILTAGIHSILPGVSWNTFLGGTGYDEGGGIAVDGNGNTYVTGFSQFTWGTPLNAHSGEYDAYIAKFNSNGGREWHTFIGGGAWDFGEGIALDDDGDIYVTGVSLGSWGAPLQTFTGSENAFVAKLNSNGVLQWNTFLGGGGLYNYGYDIALDASGNVYVTGTSGVWGTPLNPHGGAAKDAFVAKMNNNGVLQWHTFLGGDELDEGFAIDVTPSGDIFIAGESDSAWGTPVSAHSGSDDAFVAKLDTNGALQWSTFAGGASGDRGAGVVVDGNENVYVTGFSWWGAWGTPVNQYGGGLADAFVVKLDENGNIQWNTFLGGIEDDAGRDIAVDGSGNIYVTGYSGSTWGTPINIFAGYDDAFVAKLNENGDRIQNTFLGGYSSDYGYGLAIYDGKFYVTGYSGSNWGNPVVAHTNSSDTFVATAVFNPLTTFTFNSISSQDGWVLESLGTSNKGGTLNKTSNLLYVGDNAQDKQYRSFLSFDTAGLPNNAVIMNVQLMIKVQGFAGGNMLKSTKTHGNLLMDIRKLYFGTSVGLVVSDFQAGASKSSVGALGNASATGWYTVTLKSTAYPFVNKTGTTQFRLRFAKDDNNDNGADYIKIFSGNAPAASRPQLIVEYYVP